ncbi:MAG: tetratricopeptide repeat protein [Chitinophagales bacterium]|jgi:tetratricopeptide (TPR) repeat protein|nr:tetratricopeptide repeat protein [Chitinophagales bacterium]
MKSIGNRLFSFLLVILLGFLSCERKSNQLSQEESLPKELIEIQDSLTINPKDARQYFKRALYYWGQNENEKALLDFYNATKYDSTNPVYFEKLADFFVETTNLERAAGALGFCIKLDNRNPMYYLKLGKINLYIKDYSKALSNFNDALKLDKYAPEPYFYKGILQKEIGDTAKAISSFITASEQDPTWDEPFQQIGLIYLAQKNPLALTYFDNSIKVNPKNMSARMNKAYFYVLTKKYEAAIPIYEDIINNNPLYVDAVYNLGIVYHKQGNKQKAIAFFEKCIQIQSNYTKAYVMLSKLIHDKAKSKSYRETALKLDPTLKDEIFSTE